MMKKIFPAIASLSIFVLSACSHSPEHTLSRGNAASAVMLVDAPPGATLQSGELAVQTDSKGKARLVLPDGWHEIFVFVDERQIHAERVFLQDGTQKTIDLIP